MPKHQVTAQFDPVSRDLKLFTLNIAGPSVERADRLADFMLTLDLDVLVLTETRANPGTERLLAEFADAGYAVQSPLPSSGRERGVAVLSRMSSAGTIKQSASVDLSHRLVVGDVGDAERVTLLAAYVPSRDATQPKLERKRRFLAQMLEVVEQSARTGRVILMGDLNIVSRAHHPRYSAFRTWEYDALDHVLDHGLVDVFARLHPGVQAHSWIGRTGNGYRYDYAFVSEDLIGAVRGCEYIHEPRERGLSDHAALVLTLCSRTLATNTDLHRCRAMSDGANVGIEVTDATAAGNHRRRATLPALRLVGAV